MKKKIFTWIIIIAVIGGIVFLRFKNQSKTKYTSVKVTKVVKGEVKSYLSTTGDIQSKNIKNYFGTQAKVNKVNIKVGDKVKKGDVLVEYEVPDLTSTIKQAELQYDNAILSAEDTKNQNEKIKATIANLDSEISKLKALNSPINAQTIVQLQQQRDSLQPISEEKLKQLDNAVELSKIALDSTKKSMSNLKQNIISEVDGVVTTVNIIEGGTDNGMQPAVVTQDVDDLKIVAAIGKYDANSIKLGQEVVIKNGNNEYKGKVSFIDPAAQKTMSTSGQETSLNIEIDVIDKAQDLKIGFDTDIDILLGTVSNVLKIPAESVKTDNKGNNYAYIVENGKAIEKQIKLGLQSDTEAEIISGISEGSKVILNPGATITNGTLVQEK